MLVLVCYDVNTETKSGRRRLRRVAKLCESTGQRVQKSVFECQLDIAKFETLERQLLAEIDPSTDCLRLYRIPETRGFEVWSTAPSRPWILTARWCCSAVQKHCRSAVGPGAAQHCSCAAVKKHYRRTPRHLHRAMVKAANPQ